MTEISAEVRCLPCTSLCLHDCEVDKSYGKLSMHFPSLVPPSWCWQATTQDQPSTNFCHPAMVHLHIVFATPFFYHITSAQMENFRGINPRPNPFFNGPSRGWCHPGRTPGSPSRPCGPPPSVSPGRKPREDVPCAMAKRRYTLQKIDIDPGN